jgi:hypothetical protein
MAQQTAIEWLRPRVLFIAPSSQTESISRLFSEAIEKDREQRIDFAKRCLDKALDTDVRTAHAAVEAYYNQIYNI